MADITILGAKGGPAVRKGGAMPTSALVRMGRAQIVVDCGLGVTRGLVEAGMDLRQLSHIVITHLHSDHLLELGPLIGQRSAGAGVWLSDTNRLVDQGLLRAAQLPQYTPDGRWMVEGRGVAPDIEVLNPPHATWRGEDAQLEAAIEHLLQRLDEAPLIAPQPEPIPPRGQDGFDMHGLNH